MNKKPSQAPENGIPIAPALQADRFRHNGVISRAAASRLNPLINCADAADTLSQTENYLGTLARMIECAATTKVHQVDPEGWSSFLDVARGALRWECEEAYRRRGKSAAAGAEN